jgi:hypothetical protein
MSQAHPQRALSTRGEYVDFHFHARHHHAAGAGGEGEDDAQQFADAAALGAGIEAGREACEGAAAGAFIGGRQARLADEVRQFREI